MEAEENITNDHLRVLSHVGSRIGNLFVFCAKMLKLTKELDQFGFLPMNQKNGL